MKDLIIWAVELKIGGEWIRNSFHFTRADARDAAIRSMWIGQKRVSKYVRAGK